MSIVVEVTKDDIRKGVRKSSCSCPIALALTRAIIADLEYGGRDDVAYSVAVEVEYDDIRFWDIYEGEEEFNLFPVDEEDWYAIKNFIENFDLGNDVEPFNVELKYN
tara:strand:- start:733 stop:1053 length:321 start_codon:yes stop_codon:yes gene_type:complete